MIAVTQPRRVAATSLAARVAAERGTKTGGLVGYSVRFDEACSAETKIKYVSDGMLVRELLSDPLLLRYSVIVLDEAHERTLRTDFLIASLKGIMSKRREPCDTRRKGKNPFPEKNPLKIIIMSATLDAEKFSRFYDKSVFLLCFDAVLTPCVVPEFYTSKGANTLLEYSIRLSARRITSIRHCAPFFKSTLISLQAMFSYSCQVKQFAWIAVIGVITLLRRSGGHRKPG